MTETVIIPGRFNGPPGSGQGGYVAGVAASLLPADTVEVTLRKPPPLDTAMHVAREGDRVRLSASGDVIVDAHPADLALEVPARVSFDDAVDASKDYPGFERHPFPTCFVCGPARAADDGLHLFTGLVASRRVGASPWIPSATLADEDGLMPLSIMWGALDCPSWWGATSVEPFEGVALLGRLTARVGSRAAAGERCVVLGWPLGRDGRKIFAGSAVYAEDGHVHARARATWIALRD